MKISLENIADILNSEQNFTIVTHKNPDGDAIGSSLAIFNILKILGKNIRVLCSDFIPYNFRFLNNNYKGTKFENFVQIAKNFEEDDEESYIISVDLASANLLGSGLCFLKKKINLCLDHHSSNDNYAESTFVDKKAAATCEIIYKISKILNVSSSEIATCMYTGIVTDTGGFSHANVTKNTHKITSELITMGANNVLVSKKIFASKTLKEIKLKARVLDSIELVLNKRCAFCKLENRDLEELRASKENAHGFASIPREIENVLIGVFLREESKDLWKVSIRTEVGIDASKICKSFGGGGHINASGCLIGGPLKKVKHELTEKISEHIQKFLLKHNMRKNF
ncbi:MAG: bifunctional oligoribonuclease/PAP phosphatase NrnA [Oscillospiraceae bacterium]|jgi:phosphoesterase RecJ-like protein|nr:bifunctional oligoribonuclease/PAP phosphatase NrnA [Oscillospiraceae bacterium]